MITITTRFRKDLTLSPAFCDKKEWIATAAMLAGSVASSLIGGNAASKAAKRAKRENTYRTNAEKAWYDKNYNTDYMDTKAGSNLMRRAKEIQDEYVRKADGAAAVGGGTASSVAQAKEAANKAMGDTVANVAAQDTARKNQVSDQHLNNVNQLSMQRQEIENNRSNAVTSAAQGASNALMSAAVNQLGSELEKGNSLNNSTLGENKPTLGNKNVTNITEGLSHKVGDTGYLNPASSGKTMLDDAVGDLMKRKPNVPHVGV